MRKIRALKHTGFSSERDFVESGSSIAPCSASFLEDHRPLSRTSQPRGFQRQFARGAGTAFFGHKCRRQFVTGAFIALLASGSICPVWAVGEERRQVYTAAGAMSVDDAIKIGLASNPQVKASLAGVSSALASYHALGVPVPITFGASQVTGTSNAASIGNNVNDSILSLGGTLDTSGQRRYQAAGANSTYASARYQHLETLLIIEQQIRDAYWTLAASEAQEKIADESFAEAKKIYDLTSAQLNAGVAPKSDVVRSSIDVANAKQAVLVARGAHRSALIAFNTILARPTQMPAVLDANLSADSTAAPVFVLPPLGDVNRLALSTRPLMKAAVEQVKAATYSIRQAESARFPDITLSYQRSVIENVDALTVTASFPLFDFGGIGQSVRSTKEARKQAEEKQAQTQDQISQQVAQAYSDATTAVEAATSYKSEILTPSINLLEMARIGYQNGATGILPVIDAESTIRNAKVGYINAILAVYKAQDELIGAVGLRL